jgi:hypothetical protein
MEKLLPNITEKRQHYNVLQFNTPKLTPSWKNTIDIERFDSLIDIPSCWSKCEKLWCNVRLNNMENFPRNYDTIDLDAVFVKQYDLNDIIEASLYIGGVSVVSISKNMINDFCDRVMLNDETYINLFSKFIDKIPLKSCYYQTVYVSFEYDKFSTDVESEKRWVFKYCRYDYDPRDKIFDDDNAYEEVDVLVYHGNTPNIKLLPSQKLCETPCDMISFLNTVSITEPYNLGLSRYIFFEAQSQVPEDIVVTVDDTSFIIPEKDLFYLENAKQFMWSVPYDKEHGFVRVQGKTLTTTLPIKYTLHANTLQVRLGLAGAMFTHY